MSSPIRALVGLAVCATLLAGCVATPESQRRDSAVGFEVIDRHAALASIAVEAAFVCDTLERAYRCHNQPATDEFELILRCEGASEHAADFVWIQSDGRSEFVQRLPDGSLALTAAIDQSENALTLFDPPLIICPPVLEPGVTFEHAATMRVMALDQPRSMRERGSATRRIVYVGDAILRTEAGDHDVAVLEIHFHADLRLANATETTTLYVSRTHGLIAQQSSERVTILGLVPRERSRTMWRTPE